MAKNNIEDWIKKKQIQRKRMNPDSLFEGIQKGRLSALSSGITLVESQNEKSLSPSGEILFPT